MTIALYRELLGLRRRHPVLSTGGLRWLHVSDDALVFVRDAADASVLVLAKRAGATSRFEIPDGAELLVGDPAVEGPAFVAWALPGVDAPWRAA